MTGEQAKELGQLELWKAVQSEIDGLIAYEEKKFRTCRAEELEAIRQKIMAYESIKNLPQNIIDREAE